VRFAYGADAAQFGDFYPARPRARQTAVVVIHGGFWRADRGAEMTAPLAAGLARRGWNVWNIEYRRAGQGGWRATLNDCAAAVDHLAVLGRELSLDLGTALVLGHSAGGHLAVWSAGRSEPAVRLSGVVSVAGVLDLDRAARTRVGDDAAIEFVGHPDDAPDRYRDVDPMTRLPTGVMVRCIHSRDDERVPFEQSARYVASARRAGDDAQLIEVDGAHADGIDLRTPAGQRLAGVLEAIP
jgi:acetyl esterase/lipase